MVDRLHELGKPKGWTREDAESEVVRYLQRQALRSEGGLDGSAQELPTFALLALVIVSAPRAAQRQAPACCRERDLMLVMEPAVEEAV